LGGRARREETILSGLAARVQTEAGLSKNEHKPQWTWHSMNVTLAGATRQNVSKSIWQHS
jgi:hypothetical protein